ncbi:serine/threonine-protein kinase [Nocardia sp. NBC_00416]|uniref:serine/threonine-protein kinase n=1 Tax=Nocardia sp. NBC_00416 TaxID=2975991 RepID=UPI002E1D2006
MLNNGDVFAGFTIERLLGEGGMGAVYLARHPRLGKQTALKLLKPELFADAAIRTRFEREADLAAALDHPGIVTVYDRGAEGDHLWMCMQYIDGADAGTVNALALPPEKAVQIIDGVADALDYAHGMGVLHRDVKPSNILLARANPGQGERVFLTDFGLARLRAETVRLTQTGMFTATLAFASPEQMTGGDMDGRSDQYSLACALYWLLTGMAPFDSPNPADIIHGNLQLAPPPLAVKRPGLPPGLDPVLAKAMAKHPGHRYRTCLEFAAAAAQALTAPPPNYPATESSGPGSAYPGAAAGYPAAPAGSGAPQGAGAGTAPLFPDSGYSGSVAPHAGSATPPGSPAPGVAMDKTGSSSVAPVGAEGRPGEVEHTGARRAVVHAPPAAVGRPGVEQTGGSGVAPGVEHTGGLPVQAAPQQEADRGAAVRGGYGPPPGGFAGPGYHGYHPESGAPVRRRSRAPLIAVAILVPLIVLAVILAGVLVILGTDGSASDNAPAAPGTSTLERTSTGTTDPGESGPDRSPSGEPGDRTRRLFPTLLPQGSELDGFGYQDAMCSLYEAGDQIPVLDVVPVFDDMLEARPWESIWDCRQRPLDTTRLDYTIITYPDAQDAREVFESLPPHDSVAGAKSGEPYTAHFWEEPGDRGRSTANMVVSFGSGVDSPRSNSLLFVRHWGAAPRGDIQQWWSSAPL